MIVQRFNLNLIPNQSPVVVHVNQYDTGTGRLIATLYEGNEPYSPSGTAVIQGTKPDGHGFQYTATLDGNVVTADLTEQMSPVAGDVRTQIVVTESSGVTGTFVFIMRVQPSALPSDTDMSESDYQYIEEAIREAQEAVQTAQEATETAQEAVERAQEAITETQENAENSEAWAQGTRGGIPVGPTDPTYEHNAEYWAQYAERYAQGGLHYKGSILFANIPTTGMREGDMYDITDDFTTDSRFTEGAGIEVKGGTNIAWNSDNKWDILALPYIPKTTFNGRSGSILPMAGDYDSKKILLSSALHIGGETQNDVQEALEALSNDGVKSFNGRSGSVLPMAGDYDSEKILLASVLHIGGETQDNVQKALEALEGNKADKVDNAIADNFAGLDANGNLKNSGKNAGDFATPSDIAGQQSLLKDTVGWTGKNKLHIPTSIVTTRINGVTFTVNRNSDGEVTSIVANGTATANSQLMLLSQSENYHPDAGRYVISRGGEQNSNVHFFVNLYNGNTFVRQVTNLTSTNSFEFNIDYSDYDRLAIGLWVDNGKTVSNVTIYPMLRRADITDPTYEPYHESVEVMYEEEIHGVNLLKVTARTQTTNGVTFTVNADGSITVNGTAGEGNAYLNVTVPNDSSNVLKAGSYTFSGCPADGSLTKYVLFFTNPDNTSHYVQDTGKGGTATLASDVVGYRVTIRIYAGYTANNLVFKPMLRKAEIDDPTYRPYNPQAIQNQLNAHGVLGAKNWLPNIVTNQTKNGITWTKNSDGTLTANGTATAASEVACVSPNTYDTAGLLQSGQKYIYSIGIPLNMLSTYGIEAYGDFRNDTDTGWEDGLPIDTPFNGKPNKVGFYIRVKNGVTVNNLVFKPMVRLASDPDDTYQPYAMTNRELTEKVFEKRTLTSANDLNNITETGIYGITTKPTNAPEDTTMYCTLIVQKTAASDIRQIIIRSVNAAAYIYTRSYGGNPSAWTPWYKFTGTVVS